MKSARREPTAIVRVRMSSAELLAHRIVLGLLAGFAIGQLVGRLYW